VSNTGVVGLTLGGGLGWLMGKCGLAVDNVISADVVTADGQFHQASAQQNSDLFWALRGGGGNFGVVTSIEYRLHAVSQVLGGMILFSLDQAREVFQFYRSFCATLPDEAELYAALLTAPQGMPVVALLVGYNGPIADGERVFAPARRVGRPLADLVGPMPYSDTAEKPMLDEPSAMSRDLPPFLRGRRVHGAHLGRTDRRVRECGPGNRFSSLAQRHHLLFTCTERQRSAALAAAVHAITNARRPRVEKLSICWSQPRDGDPIGLSARSDRVLGYKDVWDHDSKPQVVKRSAYRLSHSPPTIAPEKVRASFENKFYGGAQADTSARYEIHPQPVFFTSERQHFRP
jgi:hypothetical protein